VAVPVAGPGLGAVPVRSRKRRSGTAKAVTAVAVGVVVLVVAGSVTAYAATRTAAPDYRTAAATTQTVEQVLQSTGTIEPGTSASVSFPVSGTVVSVQAVLGNHVTKGQQLAALDTTSLNSAVASANATVTHAQLTLYQAEHGQTSSGSSASGSGSGGSGSTSAAVSSSSTSASRVSTSAAQRGGAGGSGGSGGSGIAGAQQRLVASVHAVDLALAKAKTDLALAATLCATTVPPATATAPSASPSASPAVGGPPAGTGSPVPTTCAEAQQLVLTDETQILGMQQGISTQEAALDKLIAAAAASAAKSSSTSGRTTTNKSTTTTTVSAAQLAADQAAVDAAVAALAVSKQELAQAVITAPMTGTVSSVGVTVGEQVSAGSSSEAVDVISPTQHSVSLLVDVTKVPLVKVGQQATVLPDGSNVWLPATVAYVGAAPSTSGGTSYLVRLSFTGATAGLRNGIQAAVKLVVANAADVVSVPSSAVQHLGSIAYVTVLANGTESRQVVTLGAVGAEYTQVAKGLTVGQQVVLANMDEAIPTSTVTTRFARFAGGTGLGGGLGTATGGFGAGGGAVAGRG
jgi:RND family efflux transporter MFP subunit